MNIRLLPWFLEGSFLEFPLSRATRVQDPYILYTMYYIIILLYILSHIRILMFKWSCGPLAQWAQDAVHRQRVVRKVAEKPAADRSRCASSYPDLLKALK